MSQYKEKKGLKTVLALCFSLRTETYHHWRVFSHGSSGVCIEFERGPLVSRLNQHGVVTRPVDYIRLDDAKKKLLQVDELPFAKRAPYKPESEFRALYASSTETLSAKDVQFELTWIRKVTLSPWLPEALVETVRMVIKRALPDGIPVVRSTLISNDVWKALGERTPPNRAQ